MFVKKTLLILGAGASIPYGYPSGLELVKKIIDAIDNDEIYFPLKNGDNYEFNLEKFSQNNNYGIEAISNDIKEFPDYFNYVRDITIIRPPGSSCKYIKINLHQIIELEQLRNVLTQHAPISIDNFLRVNPSFRAAGKLMITYCLLKCEDPNKFEINNNDNWYPYLLNDILHTCADRPENISKNNLEIVSFNYDVSLDRYLFDKLSNTEILTNYDPAKSYLEQFNIQHIYGSLYDAKQQQSYGKYFSDEDSSKNNPEEKVIKKLKRFNASFNLQDNISVMYEERLGNNKFKESLMRNEEIIIIGFGFDRTNLDILGFPKKLLEYNDIFPRKTIKYLNYKGKMTALDFEFEEIKQKCEGRSIGGIPQKVKIVKSHAESIKDAYSYDFKSSLI
tara:strand:+ start:274 stop:1446 length:1173 start_codon:yes stop_codon:yes gene_type:complete